MLVLLLCCAQLGTAQVSWMDLGFFFCGPLSLSLTLSPSPSLSPLTVRWGLAWLRSSPQRPQYCKCLAMTRRHQLPAPSCQQAQENPRKNRQSAFACSSLLPNHKQPQITKKRILQDFNPGSCPATGTGHTTTCMRLGVATAPASVFGKL